MIIPALIRCPLRLILPLSLLLVAAPAGAVAQEDPGDATSSQGPQYDRVWRAIELGHADPLEMQDVVRSIFTDGIRTVVDQRTRTLLVSGIAPVIAQVQELVARLDVPVKSPAKKRTTFL
ncbi:MAG: secretin N-terminal domain-containing protein, partial [Planctomycetota bacterium]